MPMNKTTTIEATCDECEKNIEIPIPVRVKVTVLTTGEGDDITPPPSVLQNYIFCSIDCLNTWWKGKTTKNLINVKSF